MNDWTKEELDAALNVLIAVARSNPNGECWAMIRAQDAETGEQFEIEVRRKEEK